MGGLIYPINITLVTPVEIRVKCNHKSSLLPTTRCVWRAHNQISISIPINISCQEGPTKITVGILQ